MAYGNAQGRRERLSVGRSCGRVGRTLGGVALVLIVLLAAGAVRAEEEAKDKEWPPRKWQKGLGVGFGRRNLAFDPEDLNEYLAGQRHPDRIFSVTGMNGAQHMARARLDILRWIEERSRWGFTEWHSDVYYQKDITPLLSLAEWAEDEYVADRAPALAVHLLLKEDASFLACLDSSRWQLTGPYLLHAPIGNDETRRQSAELAYPHASDAMRDAAINYFTLKICISKTVIRYPNIGELAMLDLIEDDATEIKGLSGSHRAERRFAIV